MTSIDLSPAKFREFCRDLPLSDQARAIVAEDRPTVANLEALRAAGLIRDLFLLLVARLSKQEAIWWGCLCAWHAERPNPPPAVMAVYQAVFRWLHEPTDERRRETETAQKAAPAGALGTSLAQAVFFSGGSVLPPNLPEVLPPRTLPLQVLTNVAFIASRRGSPDETRACERLFLRMGLQVLDGQNRWELRPS